MNNRRKGTRVPAKTSAARSLTLAVGLSLLSGAVSLPVFAADVTAPQSSVTQSAITGIVLDAEGEPLMGVNVRVEGTKTVTTTDVDGRYKVRAAKGQTLSFSYVGYETYKAKVGSSSSINVTMTSNNELNEVVVVGYGTVRKADLAGSVSVLDDKAFQAQPITQVADALQGRVSGVSLINDGLPGGSVKIQIRGANSINKSNEPLYVVDGMVRESGLDGLNPEDIASMQILKDASSTAIYGSRGANGVVIITTKTGHKGESKLTFDASVGWAQATRLPKMMSTRDYANELVEYGGVSASNLQGYLDGSNPGIDWADEMFRTGQVQNYKLVFSKGTESMQYYLSANYMRHEGVIENSLYERFAGRANVKADIFPWLSTAVDINMSHGTGHGIGGMDYGAYNPVYVGFNSSPTMEMFSPDGIYNRDPYCTIQNNALGILMTPNERRRDILNAHVDLRFNIVKGLTFTTSNGVDYFNLYNYGMTPSNAAPSTVTAMSNSNMNRMLLQSTNNFTYVNTFNDKHSLTATAVWEATKATTRSMNIGGTNLGTETVGWWNVKDAATITAGNGYTDWSLLSAVARVIYSFDNRYMLTGTFRADGSSRLSNNKWCYFPSVAAAWTISNEQFMQAASPVLSNLKLRASWGIIGNQDIAPYSTLAMMSQTLTYYSSANSTTGYWANQVGAPNLKWERTNQVDVGIDLGLLNNRIDVSLDWYYKRTNDALLQTTLADYLGGSRYYVNAGEVSNTGIDLAVNARVIDTPDWHWSTAINLSYNRNRVEKMTTQEPVLYSGSMQSVVEDAAVVMEGHPIGSLYGYRWAGIDAEGYDTYYTADNQVTRTPSADDRCILGQATPSVTLGWNNTLNWKNWSLNAFFNSAFGAKRINVLRYAMNSMVGNSRMITAAGYFDEMGKTMPDPRVANNNYIGNSSKWVENANYFRLENISLAYEFPRAQTHFADVRLSFSVQNAFTITSYKGMNPATYSFGGDGTPAWAQGIDTGTMPVPRTYTIGARFTF